MTIRKASRSNLNATSSINNPGVGGLVPPIISTVIYTDSNYNTLDDIAVGMNGGYVRILGSGFASPFSLFLNGVQVTTGNTTFVSQNEVRALLPASQSIGTFSLMLFVGNNSGNISPNGVAYSPFPVYVSPVAVAITNNVPFTQQLGVTGDAPLVFSIISGSLPTGVTMSSSGLLSGTATGYTSNVTFNFTVQVDDNEKQSITQAIALSVLAGDTFWKNTTLLLNGVTPTTTFINDASTNNSQLTVFGDTRPTYFTPYSNGYYSNFFDGTGDFLTAQSITFGTNAFTIEFWAYPTSIPTNAIIFATSTNGGLQLQTGSNNLNLGTYGVSNTLATSSNPYVLNQWLHIVVVRSGTGTNQTSIYFNGVRSANGTVATNYAAGTATIGGAATQMFFGYISNFRVINGSALYDPTLTTLTVPTTPLTAVANTVLLTCQSNSLIDNSNGNNLITKNGDVTVNSANPFATPTTVTYNTRYSTSFDGTGDYITAPNSTSFSFGTGDFTVEFWMYLTTVFTSGYGPCIGQKAGDSFGGWVIYRNTVGSTDKLAIRLAGQSGASNTDYFTTVTPATGIWQHWAVVRSGTTLTWYCDGVACGVTNGVSTNITESNTSGTMNIGRAQTWTVDFQGYLSNVRVVKGTAVYTAAFTPSTTPLTAVSGTSLLTCQSATIVDNSTNNFTLTSFGQVQPFASSPFAITSSNTTVTSLGSAYYDGTGDYISWNPLGAGRFGTGDFTVELWFYPTISMTTQYLLEMRDSSNLTGWVLAYGVNVSGSITWYNGTGNLITEASPLTKINQWNHVAFCRSGTSNRLFINGVQTNVTVTDATNYNNTNTTAYIGSRFDQNSTITSLFTGYIADVRFIKGTALYTANFLPPQTPLTPITNTSLLTCQFNGGANNNSFIDRSGLNTLITRNGNVTQGTFSPFSQNGWSYYYPVLGFNTYAANPIGTFGTGATFTVEGWVNMSVYPATNYFLNLLASCDQSTLLYWSIGVGSTGLATVYWFDGIAKQATGSTTLTRGVWYHVAVVVTSGLVRIYVNGNQETLSGTTTLTNPTGNSSFTTGTDRGATNTSAGYISNLRTSTTAVYTSPFTPSTTPLQAAISSTVSATLLTAQNNRFMDLSPNARTLTLGTGTAAPSVQAYSPFGGITSTPTSYSHAFDGSTSFLTIPSIPAFGTASFTLEFWYYIPLSSIPTFATIFDMRGGTNGPGVTQPAIYVTPSVGFEWYFNANTAISSGAGNVKLNQWSHFAICRDTTTTRMFIDGVLVGTLNSDNTNYPTASSIIGKSNDGVTTRFYQGFISNFRICTQALYSSAFTPPTLPLTAISGTTFLTSNTNTITDRSTNNLTITPTAVTVSIFNPFGVTNTSLISYSPTVNGGSMFFDGSGDYLLCPASANISGTGYSWTIEGWFYATSIATTKGIIDGWNGGSGTSILLRLNSGALDFTITGGSNISSSTLSVNTWYHFAVVKNVNNNNTISMYVNGVRVTTQLSGNITSVTSNIFGIGGSTSAGSEGFVGYISDIRITKGAALYTNNFYPPVAPLTPTATIGTTVTPSTFLLSGINGGIIDYHSTSTLETAGNTQLASEDPYGGTYYSNFFDGNGDYLSLSGTMSVIGTNDFTVEFWLQVTASGTYNVLDFTPAGTNGAYLNFYLNSMVPTVYVNTANRITGSAALNVGQWYHVAISRLSGNTRMFINGTQSGLTWADTTSYLSPANRPVIATSGNNIGANYMPGFISNLRIVNGTGTSSITPSTTPLTAVTGTSLLTCQSNSFKDNSVNNFTITRNGDVAVKSANPFQQNTGKSLYFDGTGDYLFIPNATALMAFGTGDFTVETWVYITSMTAPANANAIFDTRPLSTNGAYFTLFFSTGGVLTYYTNSNNVITSSVLTAGQWYHVAVSRVSSSTRMFVNGTQAGTTFTDSVNYIVGATTPLIGLLGFTRTDFLNGYLEDFRITNGVGRYTTTFTPPASPLLTR